MATVVIHATISLDGYMADERGSVDWMFDFGTGDERLMAAFLSEIGAVVGGTSSAEIGDDEQPYGGILDAPVFLLSREPHEPVEKNDVVYRFVTDGIERAVTLASDAAGEKRVAVLGGRVSRLCLDAGLVDEMQLHVLPVLLGGGVRLFESLARRIDLERIEAGTTTGITDLRYRVLSSAPR